MKDYKGLLFPYAYNILGTVEDAKDAVQDVVLKFYAMDRSHIKNKEGYLIKAVTNQSINIKKKNQKIVGDTMWLPEPLSTLNADDAILSREILSYSLLVLLEKLTAKERAVFILKNAFEYSHKEIAQVIDSTVENSRKLLSRATKKVTNSKQNTTQKIHPTFMESYITTIKNGEIAKLEKMLSEDILLAADGGGKISVVREVTTGKKSTSKLLLYVYRTYQRLQTIKITEINHQPALLFYENNTLVNCQVFDIEENKIKRVFTILDPNKLNVSS